MSDQTIERTEQRVNAGAAVVALAEHYDVPAAFGIVSIHNQPIVDALVAAGRYVAVRHEATCVSAADGCARVSGRLGIAVTSTGTGAGNAAGALVEALTAGSPVLHVTGQIDAPFLGSGRGVIHETKDQLGMLAAVSKFAATAATADAVGDCLAGAAAQALTAPAGPVSVEIPIDVQYAPGPGFTAEPTPPPTTPDATTISRAADVVGRARRPLVWLGGGAVGAIAEVARFVELTGTGVLTSNAGRGVLREDDERVVGNFAAHSAVAPLLERADVIVSVGTHFRSNETRHYHLRLPTPHVQIDIDPAAIGRAYPADVGVVGDAATALTALSEELASRGIVGPDAEWLTEVADARRAARTALRDAIGPYSRLNDAIHNVFDEHSPLVRDVTIPASAWANRLLDVYHPSTNVNPRGGGIGQGLGMALGAAIARPDVPTMLMVGDGGLAVHLGELGTIAQERPWLVAIVFNDGGYGVLRNLQDQHFGRRAGVDLTGPDFRLLAAAFGLEHRRLDDADAAEDVLDDAAAAGGPVIVEVDCDAIGPMPVPFVPPVPVQ